MTDTLAPDVATPPAAPAVPIPAPEAAFPRTEPLRFTGEAREYFRIWIVNVFLGVVTLGLYSPWAKVRRKRYFHGNTWLAGANFEYHGNPVAILKGRLAAFAAFAGYSLASHFSERLANALLLAMLPALPWLVVRSFAFNAANASYRNVRFRFTGTYRQAFAAVAPLVLVPLAGLLAPEMDVKAGPRDLREYWAAFIAPLAFFAAYPYVVAKVKLLHVGNSAFGVATFECGAGVGRFYRAYAVGAFAFVGTMSAVGFAIMAGLYPGPNAMMAASMAAYFVVGGAALAYVNASTANYLFGATRLAGVGALRSTLGVGGLARIYIVNVVAVAATFGLAVPWAAVRTARYRAAHLALEIDGSLDACAAGEVASVAAAGEEMGEMFGVDVSL